VVGFSSLAAAVGTAAVYPLQPAIAEVGGALGTSLASVGVFGALAAALALNAAVGQVWLLGLVLGVVGACSSVGAGAEFRGRQAGERGPAGHLAGHRHRGSPLP
jgi:hypothetical protein